MRRFDCLSEECPLFGPHLLEASAGTGKTFTIEHVFVRLLLESDIQIEEILAVTFTRAATRELKERIRSNLVQTLSCLREEKEIPAWGYLASFIGDKEAIFSIENALKGFDRSQIFTIHSFCYRMLKEFAFEAKGLFSLSDPDHIIEMAKKRRTLLQKFWEEGVDEHLLCPEQLALLFGKFDTLDALGTSLFRCKKQNGASFGQLHQRFALHVKKWMGPPIVSVHLLEDFSAVRKGYKAYKGDFEAQIELLAQCLLSPDDPVLFRKLIQQQGSLFSFLHPKNRKVKQNPIPFLHYPGFFEWALSLSDILWEAANRKKILTVLSSAWKDWEQKVSLELGIFQPDEILQQMRNAIDLEPFVGKIRGRFKAVIIDEFQDTDPLQWEIFLKTFVDNDSLKALYLVGDPKQSIYRFRNADVYTYFEARQYLGESNLYQLDTNFRSSKELIHILNTLFSRKWLVLPKTKDTIPYFPVQSGSVISSDLQDEKKSLHWIVGEEGSTYKETFLPYTVLEIEALKVPYKSVAILVKDRYEAQNAIDLLKMRQIPCVARSHESLAETFAFQSVRELLDAVSSPQNENLRSIVQAGPFSEVGKSFSYWKTLLEEKGLSHFFCSFLSGIQLPFQTDLNQVLEELFVWEQREGFSFVGLRRFLDAFEKLDVDEGSRRRVDESEDAVQILTLHVSKGLEFDIVFALGLASSSSAEAEEEEEISAEKLRQLYVAMTRAKKRLYIPVKKIAAAKAVSPIDLFCRQIQEDVGPLIPYLEKLSQTESLSFEELPKHFLFNEKAPLPSCQKATESSGYKYAVYYSTSFIQSFTSLASPKEKEFIPSPEDPLTILPRGKETGVIVHAIFEAIFQSQNEVWKKGAELDLLVEKELRYTALSPWVSIVQAMVRNTLSQDLSDGVRTFSLKELNRGELFVEMEFLYLQGPHFVKGFIDLAFIHDGKLYFIDWKTNVLKDESPQSVEETMKAHDYGLQAALYEEGLRRHLDSNGSFDLIFGGAFYLFVRTGSYVHFKTKRDKQRDM